MEIFMYSPVSGSTHQTMAPATEHQGILGLCGITRIAKGAKELYATKGASGYSNLAQGLLRSALTLAPVAVAAFVALKERPAPTMNELYGDKLFTNFSPEAIKAGSRLARLGKFYAAPGHSDISMDLKTIEEACKILNEIYNVNVTECIEHQKNVLTKKFTEQFNHYVTTKNPKHACNLASHTTYDWIDFKPFQEQAIEAWITALEKLGFDEITSSKIHEMTRSSYESSLTKNNQEVRRFADFVHNEKFKGQLSGELESRLKSVQEKLIAAQNKYLEEAFKQEEYTIAKDFALAEGHHLAFPKYRSLVTEWINKKNEGMQTGDFDFNDYFYCTERVKYKYHDINGCQKQLKLNQAQYLIDNNQFEKLDQRVIPDFCSFKNSKEKIGGEPKPEYPYYSGNNVLTQEEMDNCYKGIFEKAITHFDKIFEEQLDDVTDNQIASYCVLTTYFNNPQRTDKHLDYAMCKDHQKKLKIMAQLNKPQPNAV